MHFPDKISQLLTIHGASAGQDGQDLVCKIEHSHQADADCLAAQRNGLYVLIQ